MAHVTFSPKAKQDLMAWFASNVCCMALATCLPLLIEIQNKVQPLADSYFQILPTMFLIIEVIL